MNEKQVKALLDDTGKAFAKATFMTYVPTYCSSYTTTLAEADQSRRAIENFLRCIKRALYFCRQTLFSIQECLDDDQIGLFRNKFFSVDGRRLWEQHVPYAETVVFNFDAFTFSVRTLFEKRLVKSLMSLHGDSYEYVEKLASLYYGTLVKPGLLTIRNEVVHYNFSGSTSAYAASLKRTSEGWDISIESNFIVKGRSQPVDLLLLFIELTRGTLLYVEAMMGIMLGSHYLSFGPPPTDQGFQWDAYTVKLSDFEVPNFDVRFG
jgi:hypothetical protein